MAGVLHGRLSVLFPAAGIHGDDLSAAGDPRQPVLSRMCAVDERHIVEFVEEGVLSVIEIGTAEWHFTGAALRRARLALRLERDLELNLAGVALALELMEELQTLRRELQARRE